MLLLFTTFFVMGKSDALQKSRDHLIDLLLDVEQSKVSDEIRTVYKKTLEGSIASFKTKKEKWNNDQRTLQHVFYKIHQKYLKQYVPYQSFSKVMDKGVYGCLTATALYAIILEGLDYDYEITETNYHIFLTVNAGGKRFLIESTDPINGFLDTELEIVERLEEVKEQGNNPSSIDRHHFKFKLNHTVSIDNLVGLQYYNMAVSSFNQGDWFNSLTNLDSAAKHYRSARISEFLQLVIKQIATDRALLIQLNLIKGQYQILATL